MSDSKQQILISALRSSYGHSMMRDRAAADMIEELSKEVEQLKRERDVIPQWVSVKERTSET